MTWNKPVNCDRCGASYVLEVLDLGHQETDSIQCECCGNIIIEWKKEARSYSIATMTRRGNLNIKYEDWEKYLGKKFQFSKNGEEIKGVLKGLGESIVAVSVDKVVRLWKIETEKGFVELYPEDNWKICGNIFAQSG